tara:strand:+ start:642 stop:869 length:228 start_codon:yes stop_codon:yes gene_type:complete
MNPQIRTRQGLALTQLDYVLYRVISHQTLEKTRKHVSKSPGHIFGRFAHRGPVKLLVSATHCIASYRSRHRRNQL